MQIVIYINSKSKDIDFHKQFVSILCNSIDKNVAIKLCSNTQQVKELLPTADLLHLVGYLDTTSVYLQKLAKAQNRPTIISPFGCVEPWGESVKGVKRTILWHTYTKKAMTYADTIHVCGETEHGLLKEAHPHSNTSVIANCITSNTITPNKMASEISSLYQKVLDTNNTLVLNETEVHAIFKLIKIGIDHETTADKEDINNFILSLNALNDESWRKIWIYFFEQDITDILIKSLQRLKFTAPFVDVNTINYIADNKDKHRNTVKAEKPVFVFDSQIQSQQSEDINRQDIEKHIYDVLIDIERHVKRSQPAILHLAYLYQLLKFKDYDEAVLTDLIQPNKRQKTVSRILAVMQNLLNLQEGFMPIMPMNDKKTLILQTKITDIKFKTT